MKVAIVGSRSLDESVYQTILENIPSNASEIISGGAEGADAFAERAARELHIPLRVIRPDYSSGTGRIAPLIRNTRIVAEADIVLVFWDGASRGSQSVISAALSVGKPLRIINLPPADADVCRQPL